MLRNNSSGGRRATSPTNTTFSGISNYRTDQYRPTQPQPQDTRDIARTHYEELSKYLASYLANEPANSRSAARQKLTRLTRQQFQELSTDVYDELIRRKKNADSNDVPFLPVRDDFHPKRNQARQKLATLPTSRFKDLSSDVYYELVRRYPEFKEQEKFNEKAMESPGSSYDDFPSPDFPANSRLSQPDPADNKQGYGGFRQSGGTNGFPPSRTSFPTSPPLPDTPYSGTTVSTDYPSPPPVARSSQDMYSPGPPEMQRGRRSDDYVPAGQPSSSRRKPSDDYSISSRRKPSEDFRRPSEDAAGVGRRPSNSSNGTGTSETNANMATSGMIIPAKSTIAEEEIEVPFPRRSGDQDRDEEGGLAGLSRRLAQSSSEADDDDRDYYDKMSAGRGSVTSERGLARSGSDRERGGRASANGSDGEKVRREYEFRIATMQSKIVGLERDAEQQAGTLDDYRRREQQAALERDRDAEEIERLRERCRRLEDELQSSNERGRDSQESAALIEQLRGDTEGLLAELADVSARNDELLAAREQDARTIRDLESQAREWRKKYESAKTELRSMKATSQLYSNPKPSFSDNNLPMSSSGGIPDIHITAFLASIDGLLTAGRSNTPTRVLSQMKTVVNSVTAIIDDLRTYSRNSTASPSSYEDMESLRERGEATLSNLVAVAKAHATSAGMAPVSLLDAAASHVAAAVTDIGRAVLIRRSTKAEQDAFSSSSPPANGFSQLMRSQDDVRGAQNHQRGMSQASISSRGAGNQTTRPPSGRSLGGQSSSGRSASPQLFDPSPASRGGMSDDSTGGGEGSEEAWAELKPYLEAQTESIVYAIQSVLSGVRSPTPSPTLQENLTQIITIVSSIVAVCNDALPPGNVQGREILRDLTEHANKLSEMQALPEVTKESRQVMAKSSFAIANAMKSLQKL